MGGGSGRAGANLLLLLLLATHVCSSPVPEAARHARHANLTHHTDPTRPRSMAPAHHTLGTPAPHTHEPGKAATSVGRGRGWRRRGRGKIEYTLEVLPSPASREEAESGRLASQVTVEAQLLPWLLDGDIGGRPRCVEASLASKAAHQALQHQPPPAGVSVVILPPPPGELLPLLTPPTHIRPNIPHHPAILDTL
nr:uncharacterized protein LOC123756047 [Procambarus clarkii]